MSEDDRRLLPQEFFLEQIALSAIARQLAVAAEHGDEVGISRSLWFSRPHMRRLPQ